MARKIASDAQEAIATARFIRMSPTKARQVVDLIRGRDVEDAQRVLRFSQRAASVPVGKVLASAIANAENNRSLPKDELIVVRAWADEGPTLRRFRPRAQGRATRIRKRTCHISVVVGRREEEIAPQPRAERKTTRRPRKGTAAKTGEETGVRKRTVRKKPTAKKTAAKKTTAKKTTKKTTAKKTTAKKTAVKKTTRKKSTRKKKDDK